MSYDLTHTVERSISLQVATLPDVPGDPAPCPTYHFMLELPILIPPYFTELHANTLPTDWPASDQRGWFHADTDRRLMVFELGSPTADGLAIAFTQHTLHVPRDVFLSHITAHGRSDSSESESEPVVVPWHEWAPGHTRLTEDPNVSQRHLGLRHPCGMRALGEPHHLLLLDRGVLRITDYHPRRVARAHARRRAPHHNSNDNDDHSHTAAGGGSCSGTGDEKDDPAKEGGRDRERRERSEPERRSSDLDHHRASTGPSPSLPWLHCDPIPYVEKDIPLPDGLRPRSAHVRCVLGEDVVLLFEVRLSATSPSPFPAWLLDWYGPADARPHTVFSWRP
ncbi:hypothetical protein BC827DRAFT_502806 [Russula dissimulans]|nr:hypothetical protein BC827DRAFT_502806 [Russula dissimulans]